MVILCGTQARNLVLYCMKFYFNINRLLLAILVLACLHKTGQLAANRQQPTVGLNMLTKEAILKSDTFNRPLPVKSVKCAKPVAKQFAPLNLVDKLSSSLLMNVQYISLVSERQLLKVIMHSQLVSR